MQEENKECKKRTQKDYSYSFKMQVVSEFLDTGVSQQAICTKYGIQSSSTIRRWVEKFGKLDAGYQIKLQMKKTQTQKILDLEQRVKLLEKQKATLEQELEKSDKRALFFDMMIDIAEEELKIPIRKKPLSNQSKLSKKKREKK